MTRGDFILGVLSSLIATLLFELAYKFHRRIKQLAIRKVTFCRIVIRKVSASADIKTIRPLMAKALVCTVFAIILLLPLRLDEGVLQRGNVEPVATVNKRQATRRTLFRSEYDLQQESNDAFIRELRAYDRDAKLYIENNTGGVCTLKAISKTGNALYRFSARCGTPEQMYKERLRRRSPYFLSHSLPVDNLGRIS
jgi:hypothetical protein